MAFILLCLIVCGVIAIRAMRRSGGAGDESIWSSPGRGRVSGGRRQTGGRGQPAARATTISPTIPPLPAIACTIQPGSPETVVQVPSLSWSNDDLYDCDLGALTCTSGDFAIHRDEFPQADPLRVCKHLRLALVEEGLVQLSEPEAMPLWQERGGYLFRWTAPTGRVVYLSVDPTREWINILPLKARKSSEAESFGWSVSEQRWAYGTSPKGLARALQPALEQMVQVRAKMLEDLGPHIGERWEQKRLIQEAREQEAERVRTEAARAVGLRCGVCGKPLGHPWGTPVGTEIPCDSCGLLNLVVSAERADAKARALIDWK